MSMSLSLAAKRGVYLMHIAAVCCLCVFLTACGESTTEGGKTGDIGASGAKKRVVYGISAAVPDKWTVANSVEPGAVSDADLEARAKANPPVPVLALVLPSAKPNEVDARAVIFVANSEKYFLPEQAAANLTQEGLDKLAQNFLQQRNEAARKGKQKSDTLEWRITRETVDGHMAIVQRGVGMGPDGKVLVQLWYIYLPGGMGIAVDAMGNAEIPGLNAQMESIARSLSVAKTK